METEGWVILMNRNIFNMGGQEVGEWNRREMNRIGRALF